MMNGKKSSVPLSEFVNNGNEVPLTDVVGMAFSAAEVETSITMLKKQR